MKNRKGYRLSLASSMLAIATLTMPCVALADSNSDAAGQHDGGGVADIIVTAQRRSESVLDVPLSIQALSGGQLQTSGIKQISDLQFVTPGYSVGESNGYTQIYIRGIGNSLFVGADPSVATFIDDVPRIYGSMVNNFVDVERVEVLKGAQGGLYGRNATGGAVNIVTRQPSTDEIKGSLRVTYGTKETFQAAGYINLPLSEMVAVSVAAERRSHGAYIDNIAPAKPYTSTMFPQGAFLPTGTGGAYVSNSPQQVADFLNSGVNSVGLNKEDFWAGNVKLLIKPADNFKVTLAGDYSKKDDNNGNALYVLTPEYLQSYISGTLAAFGIQNNLPAGLVIGNPPKFKAANSNPGYVRLREYGLSTTAVWSLPDVDLTSIAAYRNQVTNFISDLTGSSLPYQAAKVDTRKHYTYLEMRAASTFDGPLHLMAGGTYLKTNFRGTTTFDMLTPLLVGIPLGDSTDRVSNWSLYGQAEYDLSDRISLTVSGRYIHERNRAFFNQSKTQIQISEEKFLPAATIRYKLDGGGNIYARWARGFKAGGINPLADITAFGNRPDLGGVFKGETVDTYEAGFRAPLLDHKLLLTGAIFYNDYKNLQTVAHANPAHSASILLALINAGSARTYGVEGSLTWRLADPVTLGVNAGYLNAKYKNFENTDATLLVPFDLSGTRMLNSPRFQFSFSADLDYPLNDSLNLVGNVLTSHSSSVLYLQSGEPGILPPAIGKSYWLTNARLGVRTSDDRYELAVFANNLFNSAYQTYGSSAAGASTQLNWGNPRIVGAELSIKF